MQGDLAVAVGPGRADVVQQSGFLLVPLRDVVPVVTERPGTIVTREDHHRVLFEPELRDGLQQPPHVCVERGHVGTVGTHRILDITMLRHEFQELSLERVLEVIDIHLQIPVDGQLLRCRIDVGVRGIEPEIDKEWLIPMSLHEIDGEVDVVRRGLLPVVRIIARFLWPGWPRALRREAFINTVVGRRRRVLGFADMPFAIVRRGISGSLQHARQ